MEIQLWCEIVDELEMVKKNLTALFTKDFLNYVYVCMYVCVYIFLCILLSICILYI